MPWMINLIVKPNWSTRV